MSERASFVLRLLSGFALLSAAGVHASCSIELSPPSVAVKYGDPVSINCSVSDSQLDGMGWEATQGGIPLTVAQHLTWTVESITDWNIIPSCFINLSDNSSAEQCFKEAEVIVYKFPENITLSSSSGSDGVMKEGQEYSLTCAVQNMAPAQQFTIWWYRGDEVIKTVRFDNKKKEPIDDFSVFKFRPTRRDNGVTFRCEAHLDLMQEGLQLNISSEEFNITVHFGPDVQCSSMKVLDVLEEESLEKHCEVTGNPTPSVKWLKGEKPIDPTAPLSREDAGFYTLEVAGASSALHVFTVLISYGPEVNCPSNYTVEEYTPQNLTCIVKGFPQPQTIWHKDEEEVELPERLTRRDSGLYVMTAWNKLSSINHTVAINVTYPPSQIVELEDSEVSVGSTVSLKCSSMGNPRPTYFWSYYRTDNVKEENDDGVSRLVIYNATAHNIGHYTCFARSSIGSVVKTVNVTVKGARRECPLEITPDRMVVQYQGGSQSATCKLTSTGSVNVEVIYWQVGQEIISNASWSADPDKDWDPRPVCVATFTGMGMCQKHLHYTLYKTPDSVSIGPVNSSGPVMEQKGFQLQCDITNVAPAENLVVKWYRGNETIETQRRGSIRLMGCLSDKGCDIDGIRTPVNVSSTISIDVNRKYHGAEFRCEALLDLESKEPLHSPNMTSSPHNITVYYKPLINTTKLPKIVPVFRGYPEELICEADGQPPPTIKWIYNPDKVPHLSGDTLIVSEAGVYNCTATNEVDSTSYEVEVILKEDYLPLIAGFVAVTVVAISIVFLFIYSIYYKNTKMRRYSLKNPRLNNQNGNVAHNGWDLQFPMTKLS